MIHRYEYPSKFVVEDEIHWPILEDTGISSFDVQRSASMYGGWDKVDMSKPCKGCIELPCINPYFFNYSVTAYNIASLDEFVFNTFLYECTYNLSLNESALNTSLNRSALNISLNKSGLITSLNESARLQDQLLSIKHDEHFTFDISPLTFALLDYFESALPDYFERFALDHNPFVNMSDFKSLYVFDLSPSQNASALNTSLNKSALNISLNKSGLFTSLNESARLQDQLLSINNLTTSMYPTCSTASSPFFYISVCLIPVVLILFMSYICIHHNERVAFYVYLYTGCRICGPSRLHRLYPYDVFLNYSRSDQDIHCMRHLILSLLDQYKTYIPDRDWPAGDDCFQVIEESIKQSRTVVLLISEAFCEDAYCMYTFKQTVAAEKTEASTRMLLVLLEQNIPNMEPLMKQYVTRNRCIALEDPQFQKKLFYSLPKSESSRSAPVEMDTLL